jgi:hypothetical protein
MCHMLLPVLTTVIHVATCRIHSRRSWLCRHTFQLGQHRGLRKGSRCICMIHGSTIGRLWQNSTGVWTRKGRANARLVVHMQVTYTVLRSFPVLGRFSRAGRAVTIPCSLLLQSLWCKI